MTLAELSPGETGTITQLNGKDTLLNRFRELGLLDGVMVRMIKQAPFNGPVEIKVRNSYLSIRRVDAQKIILEL
tara:strand:+ start:474 stop:695 length:222 start_codon:yes stop_codon:yes gene_type:complete